MPPQQQNPYEFITNPTPPPRRGLNLGLKGRIAVVAGGLIVLLMAVMVISSFLTGGNDAQKQRLIDIAKAQAEIVRASTLANKQPKPADTKNFAATTQYSVQSAQQSIKSLLANYGVKESSLNKVLTASKNTETDAALTKAANNNRYDEILRDILEQQLTDYQKLLKTAYDNGTPSEKRTLTASSESAGRLVTVQ